MEKSMRSKGKFLKISLILMLTAGMILCFSNKLAVKVAAASIQDNVENNAKKIINTGNPRVLQNNAVINPNDMNTNTVTVYATPVCKRRQQFTYYIKVPKSGILQFAYYSTDIGTAATSLCNEYTLSVESSNSTALEDLTSCCLYQNYNTASGVKNVYHIFDAGKTVKMVLRVDPPRDYDSTNQIKFTMRMAPPGIKISSSTDAGKTIYIGPLGYVSGQHLGGVSVVVPKKGTITLEISDVSGLKCPINIDSNDCKKLSINYGKGTATGKYSTGPGTIRFTTKTSAPICAVKMKFTADNSSSGNNPIDEVNQKIQTGTTPETDSYIPTGAATLNKSGKIAAALSHNKEMKGSRFYQLKARAVRTTRTTNKLKWQRVAGATGYAVFGCKCGAGHRFKRLKKTKSTSWKQRGLKRGKHYKYIVMAYRKIKAGRYVIAISKTIHITTRENKTCTMAKSIKVSKKKVTLKKGSSCRLKAREIPINAKKKIIHHRKLRFESTNPKVASVTEHGRIRAKGKGECKIYVYSQNGVYKSVKVKVK